MKISHGTRIKDWHTNNGYGYATDRMITSLRRAGYEVTQNDPSADVQIWFDQPQHWKWNKNQYRIGYHPWESTDMREEWKVSMNNTDEIWTPSPHIAQWYKDMGIHRPIYVYEHGIDHDIWTPKKRQTPDILKFLHVGGEALRKGGKTTTEAFRAAFPNKNDVELTLKMNQQGWKISKIGKVTILTEVLPLEDLVALYHNHEVFVYPSWGEGFGLNPLQAMATGMPTLVTGAWAPYDWAVRPESNIKADLVDSPWPQFHPGKMWKPRFDDLVDKMRWVYDNFEEASDIAYRNAAGIHLHYDWDALTKEAFGNLERRLKKVI